MARRDLALLGQEWDSQLLASLVRESPEHAPSDVDVPWGLPLFQELGASTGARRESESTAAWMVTMARATVTSAPAWAVSVL
jgi:hypothetical protein